MSAEFPKGTHFDSLRNDGEEEKERQGNSEKEEELRQAAEEKVRTQLSKAFVGRKLAIRDFTPEERPYAVEALAGEVSRKEQVVANLEEEVQQQPDNEELAKRLYAADNELSRARQELEGFNFEHEISESASLDEIEALVKTHDQVFARLSNVSTSQVLDALEQARNTGNISAVPEDFGLREKVRQLTDTRNKDAHL